MKRLLVVAALVGLVVAAVDMLGDLTQTRPDRVVPGSRSEVVVEVRSNDYPLGVDQGARNLVGTCAATAGHSKVDEQSIEIMDEGTVRFALEPALGTHNRRRLLGCLEDTTIDLLLGKVVSVESTYS